MRCVKSGTCWLTFTFKSHFVQFHLKVTSSFLSWGKNKYVTLGMTLLRKYIRKSKLALREIGQFFCFIFQSIVNLKLKFWGLWWENMGFHLTPKKYYFQLSPGGWECNAMGTCYFNFTTSDSLVIEPNG